MTPDEKLEARNGTLMGLVACVLVVCSLVGCGEPTIPLADRVRDLDQETKRLGCAIGCCQRDIATLKAQPVRPEVPPREPTPVPADYSALLASIADSLKKLAEKDRSLVVPPNHAIVPLKSQGPCK